MLYQREGDRKNIILFSAKQNKNYQFGKILFLVSSLRFHKTGKSRKQLHTQPIDVQRKGQTSQHVKVFSFQQYDCL